MIEFGVEECDDHVSCFYGMLIHSHSMLNVVEGSIS